MASAKPFVDAKIKQRKVMLFSKSKDPDCIECKSILDKFDIPVEKYGTTEIEKRQDCTQIENYFMLICKDLDTREVPQLFIQHKYFGGWKAITRGWENGDLRRALENCGVIPVATS